MKLKFEVSPTEIPLFKKIVSDLKRVSQNSDIFLTCDDNEFVFHNYYDFSAHQGLLFFMKMLPSVLFVEYLCESMKPDNQIVVKLREEVSKLNGPVATIPENKVPCFLLAKEQDKRYLKLRHEIQSGISSVESKVEIEIVSEPQASLDVFTNKKLEIFLPLKSLTPFLEDGHSMESALTLRIFDVDETASVSLKVNSSGFKVDFSRLAVLDKEESVGPSFTYTHVLSPRVLKPLAIACSLTEHGCLILYNDNLLGISIQHVGKDDTSLLLKAQELFIIPELAVQEDV